MRVTIYIEGGGTGNRLGQIFRRSWRRFFESAGLGGNLPKVVRGGSRNETFEQFKTAVQRASADELPLMLVDSEGPVAAVHTPWQHLQTNDGWIRPPSADDQQAFLMIQAMETWLLADRNALQDYFGQGFSMSRLPQRDNLESIPKDSLEPSLQRASANCRKQFSKGAISFELLGKVDANTVAQECSRAKSLLDYLRSL